jgi:acetyl-CoA synthetase
VARYRGEVDLADLLCDRHAGGPPQVAVRHDPGDGHIAELTFAELRDRSARFAGALARLGIGRGDRVATLLPKSVELVVATVGIWRLGAVHVPLFTAFGPEAAGYRIAHSGARAAVTDTANLPKLIDTTIPW